MTVAHKLSRFEPESKLIEEESEKTDALVKLVVGDFEEIRLYTNELYAVFPDVPLVFLYTSRPAETIIQHLVIREEEQWNKLFSTFPSLFLSRLWDLLRALPYSNQKVSMNGAVLRKDDWLSPDVHAILRNPISCSSLAKERHMHALFSSKEDAMAKKNLAEHSKIWISNLNQLVLIITPLIWESWIHRHVTFRLRQLLHSEPALLTFPTSADGK